MRYVTIPEDVEMYAVSRGVPGGPQRIEVLEQGDDALTPEQWKAIRPERHTFAKNFVRRTLLVEASFARDLASVIAAQEIRGIFDEAKPGAVVQIPEDHWQRLVEAAKAPAAGYVLDVAMAYVKAGFFSALTEAPPQPPKRANGLTVPADPPTEPRV